MHNSEIEKNWSHYRRKIAKKSQQKLYPFGSYFSSKYNNTEGDPLLEAQEVGYSVKCCFGYSVDLMDKMASDLHVELQVCQTAQK